jgi:uncharacterized protein YbjT (DUF2867 family)
VEGTKRLLAVAAGTGVSHLVYISIFGIDSVQSYPYYRVKLETERVIEGSPVLAALPGRVCEGGKAALILLV